MAKVSPLRYPGGKARLFKYFLRLIHQNRLRDCRYVEPFSGGAALALELLLGHVVDTIHLNDLDRAVYAFWHSAVNRNTELRKRIEAAPVTMDTWHACRDVYRQADESDLLDLGFATFFLNRTNRSGILTGGVIGGLKQQGTWRLDARFNKKNLLQRIEAIGMWKSRITVTQLDACELVEGYVDEGDSRTLIYLDPPYVEKGPKLYLNAYVEDDHRALGKVVGRLTCPWVVSYDSHHLVDEIYGRYREQDMRLHYSAREHTRVGREKVFFSDQLSPPDMTGITSRYRIPWAIPDCTELAPTRCT